MAEREEQRDSGEFDEAWLERLRNDPQIIVHKRTNFGPFVPAFRVEKPVDVLELIGRYDDDRPEEGGSRRQLSRLRRTS